MPFRGVDFVVGAVEHGNSDIHHGISGDDTVFHSFLDTGFNRSDVFLGNGTANDLVFELEAFARLQRSQFQPAIAVLPFTTGLRTNLPWLSTSLRMVSL